MDERFCRYPQHTRPFPTPPHPIHQNTPHNKLSPHTRCIRTRREPACVRPILHACDFRRAAARPPDMPGARRMGDKSNDRPNDLSRTSPVVWPNACSCIRKVSRYVPVCAHHRTLALMCTLGGGTTTTNNITEASAPPSSYNESGKAAQCTNH